MWQHTRQDSMTHTMMTTATKQDTITKCFYAITVKKLYMDTKQHGFKIGPTNKQCCSVQSYA